MYEIITPAALGLGFDVGKHFSFYNWLRVFPRAFNYYKSRSDPSKIFKPARNIHLKQILHIFWVAARNGFIRMRHKPMAT